MAVRLEGAEGAPAGNGRSHRTKGGECSARTGSTVCIGLVSPSPTMRRERLERRMKAYRASTVKDVKGSLHATVACDDRDSEAIAMSPRGGG